MKSADEELSYQGNAGWDELYENRDESPRDISYFTICRAVAVALAWPLLSFHEV